MRKEIYNELMADVERGHIKITPANHLRLRQYRYEIHRQFWIDRFRELLLLCLGAGISETVRAFMFVWICLHGGPK